MTDPPLSANGGVNEMSAGVSLEPSNDNSRKDLQRRLAEANERSLNAVDAIRGAEAQLAHVKREAEDLFHRLDLRERELRRLKEHLGFQLDTPIEQVEAALNRRPRPNDRRPSSS